MGCRRQNKTRTALLGALCSLLLAGCVSQQKVERARTDISNYATEKRERDIAQHCIDAGAMPGTQANLECRLGLNKPPQNPPAN